MVQIYPRRLPCEEDVERIECQEQTLWFAENPPKIKESKIDTWLNSQVDKTYDTADKIKRTTSRLWRYAKKLWGCLVAARRAKQAHRQNGEELK